MAKKIENKEKKSMPKSYFQYGSLVFGVGLLISLISAFLRLGSDSAKVNAVILIVLSVIIGIINISEKEVTKFLISSIVFVMLLNPLILTTSQILGLNQFPELIRVISNLYLNLILLVAPAAVVVSTKLIFAYAKDEN